MHHREDSEVAIVASRNDPVLLAVLPNAERDQVVDLAAIEAKDHVRVDLVDLVLEVAYDKVEAAMRVDLATQRDAVLDVF